MSLRQYPAPLAEIRILTRDTFGFYADLYVTGPSLKEAKARAIYMVDGSEVSDLQVAEMVERHSAEINARLALRREGALKSLRLL